MPSQIEGEDRAGYQRDDPPTFVFRCPTCGRQPPITHTPGRQVSPGEWSPGAITVHACTHGMTIDADHFSDSFDPSRATTAEQQARDMLERMGVENAQSFSAGDVVELANLIAAAGAFTHEDVAAIREEADAWRYGSEVEIERDPEALAKLARLDSLADRVAALLPPK